ncbi:hypothetical protein I7I51_04508 [Histoplasma capsulatum]|uniref:Uncharacterized protein n=1 Tax=Ajellomyces capsulatus TaxID=5037 RepID=A0A8A1MAR9_AJECA|nr:hypothetical protein I7I51_04508 [Histoplasma capsulatum]
MGISYTVLPDARILGDYSFRGLRLASIGDHHQGSASVVATDSPRLRQTVDQPDGKARQRIQVAGALSGGLGGALPGAPPKSPGRGRVGGANRGLEFTPNRRDSEAF